MSLNPAQRRFLDARVRHGAPVRTRAGQTLPTAAQDQGSRRPRIYEEGEVDVAGGFRNGIGADAYPLPMIQHVEEDFNIADLDPLTLPNGRPIATLELANGTAADRFLVKWEFTIPAQQDTFSIAITKNGEPFINRLYQRSYAEMIELFKKMDTGTNIGITLVQNPNTILVAPLGRIRASIIVYGYRGNTVG